MTFGRAMAPVNLAQIVTLAACRALCMAIALGVGSAAGSAQTSAQTKGLLTAPEPPPGFENLLQPQTAAIDIFFGGRRLGEAVATFEPGQLSFRDPKAITALLPPLKDADSVLKALSGPLATHPELICTKGSSTDCGDLIPEVAGIIFDENHFRADIFVSPQYLQAVAPIPERYLAAPTAGPSLVNTLGGAVAGSSRDSTDYSLQNRAVLGYQEKRLRTDFAYSSDLGFVTDTVAAQIDQPAARYTAGLFWAPGLDFIGQRRIYGFGAGTQIDTRTDREQAIGNDLIVFLPRRSQVEILRDGRLLVSRFYDSGNQILDTSGLPEGSYSVVLRIREAGGEVREEQRFFVKNSTVPLRDQPFYFAYAGAFSDDDPDALPGALSTPFGEAGMAYRLSDSLATDATVIGTDRIGLGEVGPSYFSDLVQARVAGMVSTDGDLGVLLNATSGGYSGFSFGIDARHIWSHRETRDDGTGDSRNFSFSPVDLTGADMFDGDTTQISGSMSYQLGQAQLGLLGSYQDSDRSSQTYSIGPTFYWPFWRNRDISVTLVAQGARSNDVTQAYAGLRFQFNRAKVSSFSETGFETIRRDNGQDSQTGATGRVYGNVTENDVLASDLTLGGGVERTLAADTGRVNGQLRGAYGDYFGAAEHDVNADRPATRYNANFVTGVAVAPQTVALGGRNPSESAIVVRLDGKVENAEFEVLVDGAPRGRLRVGRQLPIFLTPYRRYAIRVVPVDAPLVSFDTSERDVTLFPGNIATLAWDVEPVIAIFGRAVRADGKPVANARIEGAIGLGVTDGQGYFQVEVSPKATLSFRLSDATACAVQLGRIASKDGYAPVGTVICR